MTHGGLCVWHLRPLVMAHQIDITNVDADTADWIKHKCIVCGCIQQLQDN